MTLENLNEIESEIKRFTKRLKAAKERIKSDSYALYDVKKLELLKELL